MASSENIFNNLSSNFSQLSYGRTKGDISQINRILDEINGLDYRYPLVTNKTRAVLLVNQCCSLIPHDESDLVSKCCRLITNLVVHQRIEIEGQTLSLVAQWCLLAIKHTPSTNAEILGVLKALLTCNEKNSLHLLSLIICSDSPVLSVACGSYLETALTAVQCLEACTYCDELRTANIKSELELASTIFLKYLTQEPKVDSILYNKVLISALRGLQNVITLDPDFLKKELGLLLGVTKSFMLYSIKGVSFEKPQRVGASVLNVPGTPLVLPKEKKGGKIAKQRKPRNNKKDAKKQEDDDEDFYFPIASDAEDASVSRKFKTSDSDFSDSEHGRMARVGTAQDKVRQAALQLLLQIVKMTDKATIFGYWSSLIPDDMLVSANNLSTCILKDPSPKGRMAALHVLLTLITRSKLYLVQAETSKKYTAYTPFSVILGAMVTDLHRCLSLALNENYVTVLLQVFKCLAALVQASPYHKLMPGIARKVIRNVKVYINHRDAAVQVAALIVLECILGSEPVVPETKIALLRHREGNKLPALDQKDLSCNDLQEEEFVDFSSDEEDTTTSSYQEMPWLLESCLSNLGVQVAVSSPVKVQSLRVISAMTRNYFSCLIVPFLGQIARVLDLCLNDSYMDLRLHAGRTIDFIGQSLNQHLDAEDDNKCVTPEQGLIFWQILINNSLTALLQSQHHSVLRAVGCDCLASIGPHIFERFTRDKQILIITLLFPCSRDDDNNVRAATVRALAISVLYPSLRDDPGFVVDVALVIRRMLEDSSMVVRIKASWSLGNLSDALVLNKEDSNKEEIPDHVLLQLLQIAIQASKDNDKIKVNAVRALGNLLQLVNGETIKQDDFKVAVEEGVDAVIRCCTTGTNMKLRWNSCYAVGRALKLAKFPINDYIRKDSLFCSLADLILSFPNFKVRINAALALSCINTREGYQNYFVFVWESLLKALENTQNIEDFSEYNHQDHLVDQICLTLGHLTTLLRPEDFALINSSTYLYLDLLQHQMHKVLDRLLPERSAVLLSAATHLRYMHVESYTSEQRQLYLDLLKVYTNE
ncbi:HEAT repeat-containing protein 6-like isoform X2 [Photinus pyralis]|uniref:HEAT repeat-containing protein 6-like isoform X2 n=1 Tax=Photinus pyralis TaxID=7054 RepID=UPI0012676522|nr:HEAT repeat-containing protein 6-like isoform X2 [Photinus pyralis]